MLTLPSTAQRLLPSAWGPAPRIAHVTCGKMVMCTHAVALDVLRAAVPPAGPRWHGRGISQIPDCSCPGSRLPEALEQHRHGILRKTGVSCRFTFIKAGPGFRAGCDGAASPGASVSLDRSQHGMAPHCLPVMGPRASPNHQRRGAVTYGAQRHLAALECLKRALRLAPCEWLISHNLGLVNLHAGQHASAVHHLGCATRLRPDFAPRWELELQDKAGDRA